MPNRYAYPLLALFSFVVASVGISASEAPATEPKPVIETTSTKLAPPVLEAPPVATPPSAAPEPRKASVRPIPRRTALRPSTTTSEVPPRLTPDEEGNIPGPGIDTEAAFEFCEETHQALSTCKLPESADMSEDAPATDYVAPSTVAEVGKSLAG